MRPKLLKTGDDTKRLNKEKDYMETILAGITFAVSNGGEARNCIVLCDGLLLARVQSITGFIIANEIWKSKVSMDFSPCGPIISSTLEGLDSLKKTHKFVLAFSEGCRTPKVYWKGEVLQGVTEVKFSASVGTEPQVEIEVKSLDTYGPVANEGDNWITFTLV